MPASHWYRCRTASGRKPCRDITRILAVGPDGAGRRNELDVIDQRMALRIQRGADPRADIGQDLDMAKIDGLAVLGAQEKPVAPQATSPTISPLPGTWILTPCSAR